MAPSSVSPIPDIVRGLDAVAVALVSREGGLLDANRGFLALLRGADLGGDRTDVRHVFTNPAFTHLLSRTPDPVEGVLSRGVITLRDASGRIIPLRGAVFAYDNELLLVAEHDIGEVLTLRGKLMTAIDDLDARNRDVERLKAELENARGLATAALRDRDALLDTLIREHPPLPRRG
jgi:hypothetical protein